ncbi:aldose 1-epimerase family protein [Flavihumibacter rivuli]|uniref:aldose 1-epimerase family protein n=1 Tax=Flavihumibacter rivuli TaxID=2838156 RepID=UPI001BDDDA70|nr:aldose 1-epimerase family protein [Flavihumibacter rivuli]ULQ56210.1 aldose 1-epimerase family protein [Flavihumibacter rivuli]
MIVLQNEVLTAGIHPLGAELQLLVHRSSGANFMWSGDNKFWGKFSPVLFPIVGSLKDNTYHYNGKEYSLPRHGFAREKTFHAHKSSEKEAVFTLEADSSSHAVFPFDFRLELHYRLEGSKLSCTYQVFNTGNHPMYFSIGAHPAFAVPLLDDRSGATYGDHYLQFNRSTSLERWKLKDGLISDQKEMVELKEGRLGLSKELFKEDALVLKGIPDNQIILGSKKHAHQLVFEWEDFPFFGIWAAPDAPFVCLEPWCGIADSVHHNQQLTEKEGINELAPGSLFSRTWAVSISF